jgi:hypothetical protein
MNNVTDAEGAVKLFYFYLSYKPMGYRVRTTRAFSNLVYFGPLGALE